MKLFIVIVADKRNSFNLMQCQMVRQFMEVFIVIALAVIDCKSVQKELPKCTKTYDVW